MSSPVSPRQRDIGEVASLRAEGVDRQPQSGFPASRETEKLRSCNVASCRTLRLRHLPYPRYRAAEEDIATHPLPTAHNYTLTENTRISAHLAEDNIATLHFNR